MKHLFIIALLTTLSIATKAQTAQEIWEHLMARTEQDTTTTDSIPVDTLKFAILEALSDTSELGGVATLVVPAEVGVMMQSHILQNKQSHKFSGYRIQILSVNSAQKQVTELEAIRDKFEEDFPDIPAYLQYTVPDFKIRVGNYRNKIEAIPHLKRIRSIYPDCYAVKCEITDQELERLPLAERIRIEQQRIADSIQAANQEIVIPTTF